VVSVGAEKIKQDYEDFLGWMDQKKKHEGHSEKARKNLPTQERLDEMKIWIGQKMPIDFDSNK